MSRLLIVDDEQDIREFAGNFFRKRRIEVETAADGKQALEFLAKNKVDLILLDVRMGLMNGVDVLRHIRENNDQTKVIMVTGVEEEEVIKEAKRLGVVSYIHKPLILEELEKIVLKELQEEFQTG